MSGDTSETRRMTKDELITGLRARNHMIDEAVHHYNEVVGETHPERVAAIRAEMESILRDMRDQADDVRVLAGMATERLLAAILPIGMKRHAAFGKIAEALTMTFSQAVEFSPESEEAEQMRNHWLGAAPEEDGTATVELKGNEYA